MARTKIIPPEGLLSDLEYTSVIENYSNGIDSTGTDKTFWKKRLSSSTAIRSVNTLKYFF